MYIYIYCILYILSSDSVRTMTPSTTHLGSIFQFPGSKGGASHHCPSQKMAEIPLLLKIPNSERLILKNSFWNLEKPKYSCKSQVLLLKPLVNWHNYGKSLYWKTHYKWPFSIAMLVYERVSLHSFWLNHAETHCCLDKSPENLAASIRVKSPRAPNSSPFLLDKLWKIPNFFHNIP